MRTDGGEVGGRWGDGASGRWGVGAMERWDGHYAPADPHGLGVVGLEELKAVVGSRSVSPVLAHVEDCKHRITVRHQGALSMLQRPLVSDEKET